MRGKKFKMLRTRTEPRRPGGVPWDHTECQCVPEGDALLTRWIFGTHQGSVSDNHLDYYLDEFTFRFNRRHSRARGLLFYPLLRQSVQAEPVPYHQLIGRKRRR